jgi:hypothetical protein
MRAVNRTRRGDDVEVVLDLLQVRQGRARRRLLRGDNYRHSADQDQRSQRQCPSHLALFATVSTPI